MSQCKSKGVKKREPRLGEEHQGGGANWENIHVDVKPGLLNWKTVHKYCHNVLAGQKEKGGGASKIVQVEGNMKFGRGHKRGGGFLGLGVEKPYEQVEVDGDNSGKGDPIPGLRDS